MPYKAVSPDDPKLAELDFDHAYINPLSGVLAGYVYNSILTGRPYFLQVMEDAEIAMRFASTQLNTGTQFAVTGTGNGYTLASAVSEALPNVKLLSRSDMQILKWSELVEQKRELWPVEFLVPNGAYVH